MKDTLTIATAEGVRIYAITTKNLVQEAADRHHTAWAGHNYPYALSAER